MRLPLLALTALLPAACQWDETARAYGGADKIWHLQEINGAPFTAQATLTFPETGQIAGRAPCNRYSAQMSVPYPWFDVGPILSTKMACPDLAAEATYFQSLEKMTLAEILGGTLILKTEEGSEMLFRAGAAASQ